MVLPAIASVRRVARGRSLLLAALCLALAGPALAAPQKADPTVDPYTGGDPELLKKVGIDLLGPFLWADDHTTLEVEQQTSAGFLIRWAETRHFKIGVGLKPRPWPEDKAERQALAEEVTELAAHLPKLRRRPKEVDSWLLLHLYARRLEALYADFQKRSGWTTEAPPTPAKGSDSRGWQGRGGLGAGPYLGQHGKFAVLILEQKGDVERYFRRWANRNLEEPSAHHFLGTNSLVFVTTPDTRFDALKTERGLHCNVVYATVRNFVWGFRGFTYDLPTWVSEGLGHWYRRRVDEDYNSFGALATNQIDLVHGREWRSKTRARVETDVWIRSKDLLAWRAADAGRFDQHVMMWSRMDYLVELGDDKLARFLHEMKALPATGVAHERVLEHQASVLQEVYGLDEGAFDEQWCAWVRKNYPRK